MSKLKKLLILLITVSLALLIVMSISQAFYGSARAAVFFNSTPLVFYWCFLIFLFFAGLFVFSRTVLKSVSIIYAGCALVLVGGMFGSQAGHKIWIRLFGGNEITKGYMLIYEGDSSNTVLSESIQQTTGLAFDVRLDDFRVEYYGENETAGVRDYYSDITIVKQGEVVVAKTIEVNHPLHYGGYHIYQHSYDPQGEYTVLQVVSDSGLYIVYAGYCMIGIGVFWRFWGRGIIGYFKSGAVKANDAV